MPGFEWEIVCHRYAPFIGLIKTLKNEGRYKFVHLRYYCSFEKIKGSPTFPTLKANDYFHPSVPTSLKTRNPEGFQYSCP